MQAIADDEDGDVTIEPWDYRYYAEKLRKAQYDLDMNALRPYLQLDKVREYHGMGCHCPLNPAKVSSRQPS